jgi:hypothetical protein
VAYVLTVDSVHLHLFFCVLCNAFLGIVAMKHVSVLRKVPLGKLGMHGKVQHLENLGFC